MLTSHHRRKGGEYSFDWSVQDPVTLELVFRAPETLYKMTWGSKMVLAGRRQVLTACPGSNGTIVHFWQEDG